MTANLGSFWDMRQKLNFELSFLPHDTLFIFLKFNPRYLQLKSYTVIEFGQKRTTSSYLRMIYRVNRNGFRYRPIQHLLHIPDNLNHQIFISPNLLRSHNPDTDSRIL